MNEFLLSVSPWLGGIGAFLTTVCWLPQAVKVVRDKDTSAISLTTNLIFGAGLIFWLIYGIAIADWPLIAANAISVMFTSIIVTMKLQHG